MLFFISQTFAQCWVKVNMGDGHCLALKSDGRLWSWGSNYYGQIGDRTSVNKTLPTPTGTDADWSFIANSHFHNIAIKNDGTLWSWGNNYHGQNGLGYVNGLTNFPQKVGTDNDWIHASCGEEFSVALKNNGTLWSWGYNNYGQTGTQNVTNIAVPNQIGSDSDWAKVFAGFSRTFAIKTNGTLWAWGNNWFGALGDGSNVNRSSPVQIGTDTDWTEITSNGNFTLALKSDGSLWSWGDNTNGQLGDGTNTQHYLPAQVGTDTNWSKITTGLGHSIAQKTDGSIWSWGFNSFGQLGDGTVNNRNIPAQIGIATDWVEISAKDHQTIAIRNDGSIASWGNNVLGQLGNGTTTDVSVPTTVGVCLAMDCWNKMECGTRHTLGIKSDGSLYAWGFGDFGNLGTGNPTGPRNIPGRIGTDYNWTEASAGDSHSLAVKTDGTIWSWGHNLSYVLGFSNNSQAEYTPVQIGTATDWSKVSAGNGYSMAIKTNGSLWCWGSAAYGQLGNGAINTTNFPTQLGTATWTHISAKYRFTAGIQTNGTMWTWGNNSNGQLGDGTTNSTTSPAQVGIDSNWSEVSTGIATVVALKSNGTLWAWGRNSEGEIGDGTLTDKYIPTQIGTETDWIHIAAGDFHCFGLKSDGSLWAWGANNVSQLGIGSNIPGIVTTPQRIGTASNWSKVACGRDFSTVINSDNNLFLCGFNGNGQLGDSTNIGRSILSSIPCDTFQLGIDEVGVSEHTIKIYPNPSSNIVNIESSAGTLISLQLFDLQGRLIKSEAINFESYQLSVSYLAKGTYLLKVYSADGIFNSKIIKN